MANPKQMHRWISYLWRATSQAKNLKAKTPSLMSNITEADAEKLFSKVKKVVKEHVEESQPEIAFAEVSEEFLTLKDCRKVDVGLINVERQDDDRWQYNTRVSYEATASSWSKEQYKRFREIKGDSEVKEKELDKKLVHVLSHVELSIVIRPDLTLDLDSQYYTHSNGNPAVREWRASNLNAPK